jgi:urease alpha subunit
MISDVLTINPRRHTRISYEIGSLIPGRFTGIVLWRPAF